MKTELPRRKETPRLVGIRHRIMGMYDDMLDIEHPTSKRHPRMSELDRAAQFAPFAALTGYDRVIVETGRSTHFKADLDESSLGMLNGTLMHLLSIVPERPEVEILHFVPDALKDGGEYRTTRDRVREVDTTTRCIVLYEKGRIMLDDIYDLKILGR